MESMMSMHLMINPSTFPPKYPAMEPRMVPMIRENATADSPTIREIFVPERTREKMSRPSWSVPNQYSAQGFTKVWAMSEYSGS